MVEKNEKYFCNVQKKFFFFYNVPKFFFIMSQNFFIVSQFFFSDTDPSPPGVASFFIATITYTPTQQMNNSAIAQISITSRQDPEVSGFGSAGKRTAVQRLEAKRIYENLMRELPNSILIFTDGASKYNPGRAGCGTCIMVSTHLYKNATGLRRMDEWEGRQSLGIASNNVAELSALNVALHIITNRLRCQVDWEKVQSIEIFSDSRYAVNAVNRIHSGVANRELIDKVIGKMAECSRDICRTNLQWIPAHCGLKGNERADFLCNEAIRESDMSGDIIVDHVAVDSSLRLAIIGSRDFGDNDLFLQGVCRILERYGRMPDEVISGGCRGADAMGIKWADDNHIPRRIMCPDYDARHHHGSRFQAYLIQNQNIIDASTHVLAFPSHKGTGTQHALSIAKRRNIPCDILFMDDDDNDRTTKKQKTVHTFMSYRKSKTFTAPSRRNHPYESGNR